MATANEIMSAFKALKQKYKSRTGGRMTRDATSDKPKGT